MSRAHGALVCVSGLTVGEAWHSPGTVNEKGADMTANHSTPRPWQRTNNPGDRFAQLVLLKYLEPDKSGSRALFECDCGNRKELALRNVVAGRTKNCADRSKHASPRKGSTVADMSANTWHKRLVATYGSASRFPCAFCGVKSRANRWCYRHGSYEERTQLAGKDRGQVFATDDARHYFVLCQKHHRAFDEAHRQQTPHGGISLPHVAFAMAFQPDYQVLVDNGDQNTPPEAQNGPSEAP